MAEQQATLAVVVIKLGYGQMIGAPEFHLENKMTPVVEAWLASRGLYVKREMEFAWGICDLVGVRFSKAQIQKRLSYGQREPVGCMHKLFVLQCLPDIQARRSVGLEQLAEKLHGVLSEADIHAHLEGLQRTKFVKQTASGRYQKLNGWAPLERKVVAVELKLSRVSEALGQAINNQSVTAESYVALPMSAATHVANSGRKNEFHERAVGLLGVSRDVCKVLIPTRPSTVDTVNKHIRAHCVERFWRSFITQRPKGK